MFLLLAFGVPIGLLVLWAIVYDVRHRRDPLTGSNPGGVAKRLRADSEEKMSEWGGPTGNGGHPNH